MLFVFSTLNFSQMKDFLLMPFILFQDKRALERKVSEMEEELKVSISKGMVISANTLLGGPRNSLFFFYFIFFKYRNTGVVLNCHHVTL